MKLYLDTNIILGWFKRVMENLRKGKKFEIPSVIEFLSSRKEFELIVSNLSEAEILRYLTSEWNSELELSKKIWKDFMDGFKIEYIEAEVDLNELIEICSKIPTKKKTMTNLLHLQIAKRYGYLFLTGEKMLKEKYGSYYQNIMTYKELRQKLS